MRTVRIAAVFMMGLLLLTPAACGGGGGGRTTPTSSPTATAINGTFTIPSDFLTYDDPSGLFSISYPPDWEVNLEIIPDIMTITEGVINSIRSNVPLENISTLFLAGVPYGLGYNPNVNIGVEPLPPLLHGIEAVAAAEIIGAKQLVDSYAEISRDFTIIDGRDAAIIEYEAETQGIAGHGLVMFTTAGNTIWTVGCVLGAGITDFSEHEDDFQAIVHSLRIYD